MLRDEIERGIRTYVPAAVGFLFSLWPPLADFVKIDGQALTLAAIAVFYAAAALLEKVHPVFGWLLGKPKS